MCAGDRSKLSRVSWLQFAPKLARTRYTAKAIAAQAGKVRIQAATISPATPQRTAEKRFVEPIPMIAVLIVWVVLSGIPNTLATWIAEAAAVSAAKPWYGSSLTSLDSHGTLFA